MNQHQNPKYGLHSNFFSIRKLKLGVASVTLGTALLLLTHHEAKADETTDTHHQVETVTSDSNSQTDPQSSKNLSNPKDPQSSKNLSNPKDTQSTQTIQNTSVHNENTPTQNKFETVNFQVQKDKTNDVSLMDKYVQHPGKVFKTNDQYYFQIVLDKASVWKAIQFFDENETILPSKVVSENTKDDTKTINIEVTPGMNNIISKQHIETTNHQYDGDYVTHFALDTPIPDIIDKNVSSDKTNNTNTENESTETNSQPADTTTSQTKSNKLNLENTEHNNQTDEKTDTKQPENVTENGENHTVTESEQVNNTTEDKLPQNKDQTEKQVTQPNPVKPNKGDKEMLSKDNRVEGTVPTPNKENKEQTKKQDTQPKLDKDNEHKIQNDKKDNQLNTGKANKNEEEKISKGDRIGVTIPTPRKEKNKECIIEKVYKSDETTCNTFKECKTKETKCRQISNNTNRPVRKIQNSSSNSNTEHNNDTTSQKENVHQLPDTGLNNVSHSPQIALDVLAFLSSLLFLRRRENKKH